jgi:1,2-diacylglycerol 3-alpha-glucosyltransferase
LFEEYLKHYAPLIPAPWLRGLARRFSRRQCNALDAVIVPSRAIHERLAAYGVKTPLHVLPTGISLRMPDHDNRSAFRTRFGIEASRPVALFVGRVAHEKNIGFLLDVIDLARDSIPGILLVIAGEGPALPQLRQTVAHRGLQQNVQFIGYLDRDNRSAFLLRSGGCFCLCFADRNTGFGPSGSDGSRSPGHCPG